MLICARVGDDLNQNGWIQFWLFSVSSQMSRCKLVPSKQSFQSVTLIMDSDEIQYSVSVGSVNLNAV
jgi:hypothetical protein